jgi:hypothetical protein
METIELVLKIFWMIWIPWMMLWFGSLALSSIGYPKLNDFILKYFYYFSPLARRQRQLKIENHTRQHGTEEEKLNLHNKFNPNYQMMSESEVYEKYEGVDREKIVITPVPNFNIDTRTNTLHDNKDDVDFIIQQLNEGDEVRLLPQIKEYVKPFSVRFYNNIDVEVLNKFEKIFIFPHRTKCYRFATI